MAINPAQIVKLMTAKREFEERHPRIVSFVRHELRPPLEEGTILEVTLTKPGKEPITSNLKIMAEDIELIKSLME
ncbi:MAG: hypothetical protein IJ899_17570 [Blautia sp.]|nr:hypothetical protein [Blautia sp.]